MGVLNEDENTGNKPETPNQRPWDLEEATKTNAPNDDVLLAEKTILAK